MLSSSKLNEKFMLHVQVSVIKVYLCSNDQVPCTLTAQLIYIYDTHKTP